MAAGEPAWTDNRQLTLFKNNAARGIAYVAIAARASPRARERGLGMEPIGVWSEGGRIIPVDLRIWGPSLPRTFRGHNRGTTGRRMSGGRGLRGVHNRVKRLAVARAWSQNGAAGAMTSEGRIGWEFSKRSLSTTRASP